MVEIWRERYWGERHLKLCKPQIELITFLYLLPFLQFSKLVTGFASLVSCHQLVIASLLICLPNISEPACSPYPLVLPLFGAHYLSPAAPTASFLSLACFQSTFHTSVIWIALKCKSDCVILLLKGFEDRIHFEVPRGVLWIGLHVPKKIYWSPSPQCLRV